jgi:8-oxo-dGTP diphosphatase
MKKIASSLILYESKLLLLLRDDKPTIPNPNSWQAIGGHVDHGEDYDDAIIREIKEETNLSPKNIKYIGKLHTNEFTLALYLVRLSAKEVTDLKLGNEGQAVRFFTIDEIEELRLSANSRLFFSKYKGELTKLCDGGDIASETFGLTK